jgi:hypothetical protein
MKEPIDTIFFGMSFLPYSWLYETVNDMIMRLFEAGLTNYYLQKRTLASRRLRRINEDIGPQVLTTDHLEIAFIFCFAPLCLCLIVFIGELGIARIHLRRRKKKKTIRQLELYKLGVRNRKVGKQ